MDVLFFLKERTKFVRGFYEKASVPFSETMRKIQAAEEPYDDPPYSESEEPAYLEEWQEADEALDFIGQACLSYVAALLKLYLDEVRSEIARFYRLPPEVLPFDMKVKGGKGILQANQVWFAQIEIRFEDSGANLGFLEEILLTRNRVQHPESIGFHMLHQSSSDRQKLPTPHFASDLERRLHAREDGTIEKTGPWILAIPKDKLFEAIAEVEKFCEWMEDQWHPIRRREKAEETA